MTITSRDNSLLRRARAVRDGKTDDAIFVEGIRLCEEALSSGLKIEAVIYAEAITGKDRAATLIEDLKDVADKSVSVSEKLLESISDTKAPQGIVVLAGRPSQDKSSFAAKQPASAFIVILHQINNPANVGAILRTCEAAGVTGVIATANTADVFSPKALRGSMGSAFRIPIWTGLQYGVAVDWCRARNLRAISTDAGGARLYTEIDWRQGTALIVGPESAGLSPDEIEAADEAVRIPMQGAAESLNVAVATGIILFEAARQRA